MKKRLLKPIGMLMILFLAICSISVYICCHNLKLTEYTQPLNGLVEECTVVCLSDLHGKEYGENNRDLLDLVSSQDPDTVFVLGDMIDSDADEIEIQRFLRLMSDLRSIAPVYFSYGNHEMDYMLNGGEPFVSQIESLDIPVLMDNYTETVIGKNTVRVGGSLGHYYGYHWSKKTKKNPPDYAMEKTIGATEIPAIVLLHMPETILMDSAVEAWTGDLYLSGHTHGGVIRLPGIGGLFAPTQGFFPKYDQGQFRVYQKRFPLIITSGLSGYGMIPRIFNRPEICLVHLTPAEK